MKTSSILILIFLFFIPFTYSQSYSSLTNNSTNKKIHGVDILGNDIWMSTSEGLVKYNNITDKINFFNKANTNLPDDDLNGKLMIKFPEQLIEHNLSHLQLNLNNQLKSSGVYVLSISCGSKIYIEKFLFKK